MEASRIKELIGSAVDRYSSSFKVEDIVDGILDGSLEILAGRDSILVTQIVLFPQKKSMHILIGAGDINELISLVENVLAPKAKQLGCRDLTLVGRKGWLKALQKTGWKQKYIQLSKEL